VYGQTAVPVIVVLVAAFVAAATDIWKFKVYNVLTLPLLVSGLLYHAFRAELADSLLGVLFGFAALIVLYIIGGMGAGDVKHGSGGGLAGHAADLLRLHRQLAGRGRLLNRAGGLDRPSG